MPRQWSKKNIYKLIFYFLKEKRKELKGTKLVIKPKNSKTLKYIIREMIKKKYTAR